jgi:hypothetical protein
MSAACEPAAARETSGQGLSEIIAEYRLCALPSDDVLRGLATAGIDLAALIRRWQHRPLNIPRIDRVIFDGRGGFEFARYRNDRRGTGAMIFIVRDHIGDVIDLAAWAPPRPPALWTARGSMLGAENLFGFRMRDAIEVHLSPLEWLRGACRGVVVLDDEKAKGLFYRAQPLEVVTVSHGRELRALMEVKPPEILVSSKRKAAA